MKLSTQVAKHFREVYFGGNWTCSNLKDTLANVTWQQATTQVYSFNTIATLVYHINYYVSAVKKVLEGETLNAKDELSFNHPPIHSEEDWNKILTNVWLEAEAFSLLIEQLPEERFYKTFTNEKYGIYYRNLNGIIEHTHYHLGQIALIKKIVQQENKNYSGQ